MSSETPARILWNAAGRPDPGKPRTSYSGPCYLCGYSCDREGIPTKHSIPDTFTDQHRAASVESPCVCVPCGWSIAGQPPNTLRLWSWAWREDGSLQTTAEKCLWRWPGVHACNKADASVLVQLLLAPPEGRWFASVAESGQLHVVPFARVNVGADRWTVAYDRETVTSTPRQLAELLWHVCKLMEAGFFWGEILSGEPASSRLIEAGIDPWRRHDSHVRRHRGGPLLRLLRTCMKGEQWGEYLGYAIAALGRREDDAHRHHADERGPDEHRARDHQPDEVVDAPAHGARGGSLVGAVVPRDGLEARREAAGAGVHAGLQQLNLFADA